MLQKMQKSFEPITIVTMCFNMGMDKLEKVKKQNRGGYYEYYVQSTIKLCQLFPNIILFCDQECAEYVEQKKLKNVRIIIMSLNDLEKMKDYKRYIEAYQNMKKIMKQNAKSIFKSRRVSCIVGERATAEDIALYTVLNCSKIDLLNNAFDLNIFNTRYFYWLDAGCAQEKYNHFWNEWTGTIMHKPEREIRCAFEKGKRNALRLRIFWTKYNVAFCFWPSNQVAAGFIGMDGYLLSGIKKEFDLTIEKFLKQRLMTSEQGILSYMLKKKPKLFDIPSTMRGYQCMINDVANK